MQTTIYYNERDRHLLSKVDIKARKERKSRSAVILSVLEEYFEHNNKKLGEILLDMGALSSHNLERGLNLQQRKFADKLLGEILLSEGMVSSDALDRALMVQGKIE
ncbi:TPA: hypothetical protein DD712_04430 [Candidatus Acetothermia bacterium]|nr:hypothetical protein [Candidatus Acetothermia bacterium]